jgi:hypothetical protein
MNRHGDSPSIGSRVLSEIGVRDADQRYGPEHGQRILAMLDQAPPAGYSNWTAPLLARELVDIHEQYNRRCRLEFRDFMNRVVKQYQGWEIHVVLDNLSTHKPKRDLWLARHRNVHFHYTPTPSFSVTC